MLFGIFIFITIFILCSAVWKGLTASLLILIVLAVGIVILATALLLTTALTGSPVLGWLAAAGTAIWECKCGYRLFYDR